MTRSAGSADTVHIIFRFCRHVIVDDMRQIANIQSARRNIRCNEHANLAFLEAVECVLSVNLRFIAVNRTCADMGAVQIMRHSIAARLGAHKYQRAVQLRITQRVQQQLFLVFTIYKIHRLINFFHGCGDRIDFYAREVIFEQPLDQRLHGFRHGCGKQQRLHVIVLAHAADNAFHIVDKSHVQHAIRLIEHKQFNVLQINVSLTAQIVESARRCHEDIDTGAQCFGLVVL